jgi:xanthine dehydrogenase iron-sulfur cluster and FAD-binding subunit A
VAASVHGERVIPIREFIVGPFQNSLRPDEIAVEARLPGTTNYGLYRKIERKVGDFATVGVGVALTINGGVVERAGIALTGVSPTNIKCDSAERLLLSGRPRNPGFIDSVAKMAAVTASPRTDHRGSKEYKQEMVEVFVRRALQEADVMRSLSMPAEVAMSMVTGSYQSPVPVLVAAPSSAPAAVLSRPPAQRSSSQRPSRFPSILKTLRRTFRKRYS